MNTPTLKEIIPIDQLILTNLPKGFTSHGLKISAPNGVLEFSVAVWNQNLDYIIARTPTLEELPKAIIEKVASHDPALDLREKAEKLGYDLVKKVTPTT